MADTCRAFTRVAEVREAEGQTVHVGSGQSISIGDLARVLMEVTGIEKPIEEDTSRIRPAKSEVTELLCDASRARALLEWEPLTSLRGGLERVVEFIDGHRERYLGVSYAI